MSRNLRITDFDLAHVSIEKNTKGSYALDYDRDYCSVVCGTQSYEAPEMLMGKQAPFKDTRLLPVGTISREMEPFSYGPKVDFYSAGITLYELYRASVNCDLAHDSVSFSIFLFAYGNVERNHRMHAPAICANFTMLESQSHLCTSNLWPNRAS